MSIAREFKKTNTNLDVQKTTVTFLADTPPTKGSNVVADRFVYQKSGNRVSVNFTYNHLASGTDGSGVYSIQLPYRPHLNTAFYGTGLLFTTTLSGNVPVVLRVQGGVSELELLPLGSGGGGGCNFAENFASAGAYFDESVLFIAGSIEYLTDEA